MFSQIPEFYNPYLHQRVKRVKDIDPSLGIGQQFVPLSTFNLQGAIYLYITGNILAALVFLGESIFSFMHYTSKSIRKLFHVKDKRDSLNSLPKSYKIKQTKNEEIKIKTKWCYNRKNDKNELSNPFSIRKTTKQNKNRIADNIFWSDFDKCYDKFGSVKLTVGTFKKNNSK